MLQGQGWLSYSNTSLGDVSAYKIVFHPMVLLAVLLNKVLALYCINKVLSIGQYTLLVKPVQGQEYAT